MKINIWNDHKYELWYDNFDNYHDPLWKASVIEDWEDYVNDIIKDMGLFHYINIFFSIRNIEFNTEEDYINFVLRWS